MAYRRSMRGGGVYDDGEPLFVQRAKEKALVAEKGRVLRWLSLMSGQPGMIYHVELTGLNSLADANGLVERYRRGEGIGSAGQMKWASMKIPLVVLKKLTTYIIDDNLVPLTENWHRIFNPS